VSVCGCNIFQQRKKAAACFMKCF